MNPTHFTSYFIAIPLPAQFQSDYEQFLESVKIKCPEIHVASATSPHITVYYLSKSIENALNNVTHRVKAEAAALKGKMIKIHGLGVFTPESPKSLYLDVEHTKAMEEMNQSFEEVLKNFSGPSNDYIFVPHLTFGKVDEIDPEVWPKYQRALKKLANAITWEFPITELTIYGADSTQTPIQNTKFFKVEL